MLFLRSRRSFARDVVLLPLTWTVTEMMLHGCLTYLAIAASSCRTLKLRQAQHYIHAVTVMPPITCRDTIIATLVWHQVHSYAAG